MCQRVNGSVSFLATMPSRSARPRPGRASVLADDAVGERDPALGLFANPRKSGLTVPRRQWPQIHAVGDQDVEGDTGRAPMPEQKPVEQRAVGVVEHDQIAIEHKSLR